MNLTAARFLAITGGVFFACLASAVAPAGAQVVACNWPLPTQDSARVRITLTLGRDLDRSGTGDVSSKEKRLRRRMATAIAAAFRPPAQPIVLRIEPFAEDYARTVPREQQRPLRAVRAPIAFASFSLATSGRVDRIALHESSGSPAFDSSLVAALERVDSAGVLKGDLAEERERFILLTGVAALLDSSAPTLMEATLPAFTLTQSEALPGNERPKFPATPLFLGADGVVEVTFRVNDAGRGDPATLLIERMPDPALSREVLRVLPRWRLKAATLNGCPMSSKVSIPFTFAIQR